MPETVTWPGGGGGGGHGGGDLPPQSPQKPFSQKG